VHSIWIGSLYEWEPPVKVGDKIHSKSYLQEIVDGLVTRTVFPTIPPRVDFELTRLGRTLLKAINALVAWSGENRAALQEARAR